MRRPSILRDTWRPTWMGATLAACLALGLAQEGSAQQIRGRILDEANGSGVPVAGVFLLTQGRDVVSSALSDAEGRYALEVPTTGEYILLVQRLGYFPTESPLVEVSGDRSYDVDLSVRPEPIRIEGLEVEIPMERQNTWAKDRLRFMNRGWGVDDPVTAYGFRLITGLRLEEAKMRSKDTLDLLRWVYVPIYNSVAGLCVQGRPSFSRGGAGRAMGVHDEPAPTPTCGSVFLDGESLPGEHVEGLDLRSINAVMIVGGALHLMTVGFEQRFQARSRQ